MTVRPFKCYLTVFELTEGKASGARTWGVEWCGVMEARGDRPLTQLSPLPRSSRGRGEPRLQQASPVCTGHTNDCVGMWLGEDIL